MHRHSGQCMTGFNMLAMITIMITLHFPITQLASETSCEYLVPHGLTINLATGWYNI